MRRTRLLPTVCLLLVMLAVAARPLPAEVSAEPDETEVSVIVLGIIEGPDPIPQFIWDPIRDIDPALYLNSDGALRGDGRPDIAVDPVTGWPHVVWAYNNGTDFDVAYTRWDGSAWLPIEFLTSSTAEELDPRVYVDPSAVYVVWWEEGSSAIRLVKRQRLGDWGMTEVISGHVGMRPSVVSWGGSILVASEKSDGQGGTEIFLSTRLGQDSFTTEAIGSASDEAPLNVILHIEQDKLWMDWRNSALDFAYSEYTGSWSPPTTVPWTGSTWVELEQARLSIRNLIVSAP